MTRLALNNLAYALAGLITSLATFKAFLFTGAPGWPLMSLIIAVVTMVLLVHDIFRSPTVALIFGLTGGIFTCLYVHAFNLTFAPVWCCAALLFAAGTMAGMIALIVKGYKT